MSADHFFVRNGEYCFDAQKLPEAHQQCIIRFLDRTTSNRRDSVSDLIIVDNTNSQVWEYMPYYSVADACGYEVELVHIQWKFSAPDRPLTGNEFLAEKCAQLAKRNTHGVPLATITRMAKNWQNPLPWHKETVVEVD